MSTTESIHMYCTSSFEAMMRKFWLTVSRSTIRMMASVTAEVAMMMGLRFLRKASERKRFGIR